MSNPPPRPARVEDLPAINAIYNHYVLTGTATWQIEPETEAARLAWFRERDHARHPVTVVEIGGAVVAWGSLSPFGKREGFRHTVENSIYVHPDFQRRGLGRLLLETQMRQAAEAGHRTIVAAISAEQTASVALHARCGFRETGRLLRAGFKFGRWLDLVYMQWFAGDAAVG